MTEEECVVAFRCCVRAATRLIRRADPADWALEGIPVFGLDALGSAAYGPEAALTLLIPLGLAGLNFIVPLSTPIIALLTVVYFSYRQTIAAYPSGGGSYIVAFDKIWVRLPVCLLLPLCFRIRFRCGSWHFNRHRCSHIRRTRAAFPYAFTLSCRWHC